MAILPDYAELYCRSNFSFLRGASHPEELVEQAARQGYRAIAITDECSVAGVVRAHNQAKQHAIKLLVGTYIRLDDGLRLLLFARNRQGYGQLSRLVSQGRMAAAKGRYCLYRRDLVALSLQDCLLVWLPDVAQSPVDVQADGEWLQGLFQGRLWLGLALLGDQDDQQLLAQRQTQAQRLELPILACGDVHMHTPERQPLQDVLTAIRLGQTVATCGRQLFANAERHLRSVKRLQRIYPAALLEQTMVLARQCQFSLAELRYEYPQELVPTGHTPSSWLAHLTWQGAARRWPTGVPTKAKRLLQHELALVAQLNYEPFFLTVYDVVQFARQQQILCQGRGSAANSAVCFALGITEVDPARMQLLFERFISRERNEPPDIDVDFEHERREEVIQYIYQKYGRHRAALAASVVSYRPRSAIRDVGKALGLSLLQVDALAKSRQWWDGQQVEAGHLAETLVAAGLSADDRRIQQLNTLLPQILGFPRHLSQHVGGFVIAQDDLRLLVPVENANMEERTVIQWDKDDLESLGLLKVDVLALGMLTAIRKSFALLRQHYQRDLSLATVPDNDATTYAMIQKADTIGVFQIESRAQMSMLPRLKPANYYDLVVEVAIVRPGPIQGDMVHPYLARRRNPELVDYPSEAVKTVLKRTLGVPIFQEQVMQLAVVAAGFTPGEADQLRRSMAAWRRRGGLEKFEQKLHAGMAERGYAPEFAERIFKQIQGFGEYGFPESHAASFALLVYVSCWLKCHYPAAFTAALLNSQPMGFYRPAQLVQDLKRHGVRVLPIDVRYSNYDCTLEPAKDSSIQFGLRLGLRLVKGLSQQAALNIVQARQQQNWRSVQDLASRAVLDKKALQALAGADALQMTGHRHNAYWQVSGVEAGSVLLPQPEFKEADALLQTPTEGHNVLADYRSTGLSLRRHPVALLRPQLQQRGLVTAQALYDQADGGIAKTAGLVVGRQRPGSASGVIFVTLEDESGYVNVVVWPKLVEHQREPLLSARLLQVAGTVQQEEGVLHLVAGRLWDISHLLGELPVVSRDFH